MMRHTTRLKLVLNSALGCIISVLQGNLCTLLFLSGVAAWTPRAEAQSLPRPPQPPSVTAEAPLEALGRSAFAPTTAEAPATVSESWPGMFQTGAISPPDPHGAAGPDGILQTVNLRVAYFTKAGQTIWGPVPLSSFWASAGNSGSGNADPRAIFDSANGRFYVVMQENTVSRSYLNVAVSKGPHPATASGGDWYFQRLDVTEAANGVNYGADYPGLGVDGQAVYVTYNMYSLPLSGTATFKNCQIVVLNKAAWNSGVATWGRVFTPDGSANAFTLQPATVLGGGTPGNTAYFAETPLSETTKVRVWALSDPLGTRTFTSRLVNVPNNGGYISGAPQTGTDITIPTLSPRAQGNAFWHNGRIWFTHTAGGSAGKSIVYYYRVNMNGFPGGTPVLEEAGGIDGGPGVWTYQPAIGGNAAGDACLVYCQSSASTLPTIMTTGRRANEPSFGPPVLVKASAAFSNSERWGDYATVSADPTDGSFWVSHEWARSSAAHDWGTWWAHVLVTPPIRALYVDGMYRGSTPPNGSPSAPFRTVRRAFQAAQPGEIIRIASGGYPETGLFDKRVNLEKWIGRRNGPVLIGASLPGTAGTSTLGQVGIRPVPLAGDGTHSGLELSFDAPVGQTVIVEGSTNLVHWQAITNLVSTGAPIVVRDAVAAAYPHRFYRVVSP